MFNCMVRDSFIDRLQNLVGLTAGGIGAVGLGVALAGNQLGLGIMMFIIFVIGSLFIANAAEIAAAVFACEAFLFWIMAEVEQTITKVDSFFALIFFIIAIAILVIRRDANSYSY